MEGDVNNKGNGNGTVWNVLAVLFGVAIAVITVVIIIINCRRKRRHSHDDCGCGCSCSCGCGCGGQNPPLPPRSTTDPVTPTTGTTVSNRYSYGCTTCK